MTTETPVEAVVPEETPEAIRAAELAGFNSVMTGEPPVIEAPETPAAEVTEDPPAEEVKAEEATEAPVDEDAAPVTLTKGELKALQSKLEALERETAKTASNMNGKFGEVQQKIERTDKALRDFKAGRKLTAEQFKELAVDYPDIVKGVVDGFNAGVPEPEPVAAPEPDKGPTADELKAIKERQDLLDIKLALAAVDPAWEELTSTAEFAKWRDSHPADVAKEIQFGRDPKYLADALKGYKGHQKSEADKAAAAKAAEEAAKPKPKQTNTRLAAAITPTGAPPAGRKPTDDRAEMLKGFQSVMSK